MDRYARRLNELLVDVYDKINRMEEQTVYGGDNHIDLTIGELHMLETIAKKKDEGCSISFIAKDQRITLPSVTVAVNKLVRKGYVEKKRAAHDGRQVLVKLTRQGRKINAGHQYFHENMVRNFTKELDEHEKEVLFTSIDKLNQYLQRKIEAAESKSNDIKTVGKL